MMVSRDRRAVKEGRIRFSDEPLHARHLQLRNGLALRSECDLRARAAARARDRGGDTPVFWRYRAGGPLRPADHRRQPLPRLGPKLWARKPDARLAAQGHLSRDRDTPRRLLAVRSRLARAVCADAMIANGRGSATRLGAQGGRWRARRLTATRRVRSSSHTRTRTIPISLLVSAGSR